MAAGGRALNLIGPMKMLEADEIGGGLEDILNSWVLQELTHFACELRGKWGGVMQIPVDEFTSRVATTTTKSDEAETWGPAFTWRDQRLREMRSLELVVGMSTIVELDQTGHGGVASASSDLNHGFDGFLALTCRSWLKWGAITVAMGV